MNKNFSIVEEILEIIPKNRTYIINKDSIKYSQIDGAFYYLFDHQHIYKKSDLNTVYEFGTYKACSLEKICYYIEDNLSIFNNKKPYVFSLDWFGGLPQEHNGCELFEKFYHGSYKLNEPDPVQYVYDKVKYNKLNVICKKFEDLQTSDCTSIMGPAILVHLDADLYISTLCALNWLFMNNLIKTNSLLAYDEFVSTNNPLAGGESRAHHEIMEKYNVECEEVWHYIYNDKDNNQPIRQSVFRVNSI